MLTRIPLSAPDIDEQDISAVVGVLRTPHLSLGPMLENFEHAFAEFVNVPHAVAVSSGTAGLHLCMLALGIAAGDEVIVPSFTFIAAANCIRYVGAVPIFVDIDEHTLNMDPACVEAAITSRTRALLIVHTFGVPAELSELLAIASRHNLRVIEDACEAVGAEYRGQKVGSFGDAGVFGFYPNKQMTTGEGGIVVTRDPTVAATIHSLRNQGRTAGRDWLEHSQLGYNYRLSEMNCALGLSQLTRITNMLALRSSRAALYDLHLRGEKNLQDLKLPALKLADRVVSWFVYVVRLGDRYTKAQRDAVVEMLAQSGIRCGRYFAPIHRQEAYAAIRPVPPSLPVTEAVAARTIALPFFNRITDTEIAEVSTHLIDAILSFEALSK